MNAAISLVPDDGLEARSGVAGALPSNIDAEQALLGCVLYDNAAYEALAGAVLPRHFYEPFHARLFDAIEEAINKGVLAEPILLMERFKGDEGFKELGGLAYLAGLVDSAPPPSTAGSYAAIIADLALRRDLVRACGAASTAAVHETAAPALTHLYRAEQALSALAHTGGGATAWQKAGSVTASSIRAARDQKGMIGLSTGLTALDEAMGGLRKGQMIVLAGRPGMGKSTGGLQFAKGVARQGKGVAFFSMEMPEFDLGLRMACDVAHDPLAVSYSGRSINPSYFDAARARLSPEQWEKLEAAEHEIRSWPLAFDARPGLTVPVMLAAARRQLREWERAGVEPGAIIVDHLTIAKADQDRRGNKVAEVGDISRGLAEMAKTLDVPVVALCQLSRDVEKRDKDKRPTLADLRWSGEIEQDARIVCFLYRPEYYVRKPETEDFEAMSEYRDKLEPVRKKLFWLIEKNNNGPTAQVETYCDIGCSAIRDKLGSVR
jgi:replicative DNA helicase